MVASFSEETQNVRLRKPVPSAVPTPDSKPSKPSPESKPPPG